MSEDISLTWLDMLHTVYLLCCVDTMANIVSSKTVHKNMKQLRVHGYNLWTINIVIYGQLTKYTCTGV